MGYSESDTLTVRSESEVAQRDMGVHKLYSHFPAQTWQAVIDNLQGQTGKLSPPFSDGSGPQHKSGVILDARGP